MSDSLPVDVARFDYELQKLLEQYESRRKDTAFLTRICYELNIRSFHSVCVQFAQPLVDQGVTEHDLVYEYILASGLNSAGVLEGLADRLRRQTHDPAVLRNLALIHYYLEDDQQAFDFLDRSMSGRTAIDSRAFEISALIHFANEDFEACIEACDRAVNAKGPSARAVRLKGLSFLELGELDKAESCLDLTLELEPNFVWACHSLAELAVERGDLARAFRYFGKATYVNPKDPGNYFLPAEAFIDMGAYDLAISELKKLLFFEPGARIAAEVHNGLGYLYIRKAEYGRADSHLKTAIELEPDLAVAYFNVGRLNQAQGKDSLADRNFRKSVALDPSNGESWVEMGFLALGKDKLSRAKRCFTKALETGFGDARAHVGLARVAQKRKDHPSQLFHARRAFELASHDGDVANELGIALECNGLVAEAAEAYEHALGCDDDQHKAANNLGYLCERQMESDPANVDAWRDRAVAAWKRRLEICTRLKKSTRAATTHLRKLGVKPDRIKAWTRVDQD